MTAFHAERTFRRSLFNHLVGDGENARRDGEAERFGGFEVERENEFGRQQHRQVARFFALEDTARVAPDISVRIGFVGRKLSGKEEALLVATACSSPPEGRARWTLDLLAGEMVRLTEHDSLSGDTVRRRLAENDLKPWRKDMWCIPQVDAEYVARMEDVLDLYAEAPDPKRPVLCFDESPTQLIGEVRQPIPAEPGQIERYDCEYKRNGTANLFVVLDAHRSWRKVKVTDSRAAVDFAACMRELAETHGVFLPSRRQRASGSTKRCAPSILRASPRLKPPSASATRRAPSGCCAMLFATATCLAHHHARCAQPQVRHPEDL